MSYLVPLPPEDEGEGPWAATEGPTHVVFPQLGSASARPSFDVTLPVQTILAPLPDDPFAGTAYRAIRRLGAGGMGEVFVIAHRQLGRELVAKLLHARFSADSQLLDRMRIEAQALGRLDHANIVTVSGFGTASDGRPFIVMELLRGQTLADELAARGRLPLLEAVSLARQLLSALAAAHALGIVHRDVKPENLFIVDQEDGTKLLKVLDFGIARVMPGFSERAPQPLALPTETGLVVGTPRFVSPEGATGARVDQRADLYAAGLVLYTMLAGRGPFDHLTGEAALLNAHVSLRPEAPSAVASVTLPKALDAIILHSLSKRPDGRFQNAAEFIQRLDQLTASLGNEPDARRAELAKHDGLSSPDQSFRSHPPQNRRLLLGTPALVLLFAVIALVTTVAVSLLVRLALSGHTQ